MSEMKRYYLGTGTEFKKAQCKEYKTLDGALKAAAKDESLVVWDESGNVIGSLTDNIPDDAVVEGEGEQHVTVDTTEPEDMDTEDDEHPAAGITAEQTGRFNIKVICEGSLRLRRSPSFTVDNECGRASKGQTYIGKCLFMVDGLPMVETIDGLFLSAAAEHVKIDETE